MTITEETRYHLHQKLEAMLGPDDAATLMEHLPPVGWADVATKRDLDQFALASKRDLDQFALASKQDLTIVASQLRLEMSGLRTELMDEIRGLDGKISGLRTELMDEMSGLDGTFSGLRTELKGEVAAQAADTERHLRNWVIASQMVVLSALGLLIQLH